MTTDPVGQKVLVSDSKPADGGRAASRPGRRGVATLERTALLILLVAICVLFSVLPQSRTNFASMSDVRNIAADVVVGGVLALAAIVPLIAGEFDFSIGLTLEFTAMITAGFVVRLHQPLAVAIVAGLAVGLVIGIVNGYLVAYRKLNSFIITFAVATIVTGLIELYANGSSILVSSDPLTSFGLTSALWLGIPRSLYAFVLVALIAWYVLDHTPVGRYWHAAGSNRAAATLVGLPVRRLVFLSFVASGVLASAAGILYLSQQGSASPNVGQGYVLPAYAAVFLGATVFKIGRFNVWGTVVAVFFVAIGSTGLVFAGLQPWVQSVFQGAVLIIALSITRVIGRRQGAETASAGPKL
ncbi:MAG TPA: ABC transporter permease [Trebonia sp.]